MTILAALQLLVAWGESGTLEFGRSTAELKCCGERLCAFLNGEDSKMPIGVLPVSWLVGKTSRTSRFAKSRRCSGASSQPRAQR